MLTIVDYGMGNLFSIKNMLKKVGLLDVVISSLPEDIIRADRIILPGVGAFDHAMQRIHALGLHTPLDEAALILKKPILGICLGMQLLLEGSEEGVEKGFGWIPGRNAKFSLEEGSLLKIPHMGWNEVTLESPSGILNSMPEDISFYFVHSYHACCSDPQHVIATATHGYKFPCIIERDNIMGTQFHPEKSHVYGKQLLKNYLELSHA